MTVLHAHCSHAGRLPYFVPPPGYTERDSKAVREEGKSIAGSGRALKGIRERSWLLHNCSHPRTTQPTSVTLSRTTPNHSTPDPPHRPPPPTPHRPLATPHHPSPHLATSHLAPSQPISSHPAPLFVFPSVASWQGITTTLYCWLVGGVTLTM